jgi:hypothetical protein
MLSADAGSAAVLCADRPTESTISMPKKMPFAPRLAAASEETCGLHVTPTHLSVPSSCCSSKRVVSLPGPEGRPPSLSAAPWSSMSCDGGSCASFELHERSAEGAAAMRTLRARARGTRGTGAGGRGMLTRGRLGSFLYFFFFFFFWQRYFFVLCVCCFFVTSYCTIYLDASSAII